MMRNDDFLKNVPTDDQKYFVQKTTASEKVMKHGDKIAHKFPVSIYTYLEISDISFPL